MFGSSFRSLRLGTASLILALLSVHLIAQAAEVNVTVAPTSSFTADVLTALAGASADDYFIHLEAGLYTGCGPSTIDLGAGSALSMTVIGAGEDETTIDCANQVLSDSIFTCGENCIATLKNMTITRVKMTEASPSSVGSIVNAFDGASVTLESVTVTSCWTVTFGGVLTPEFYNASSVIKVAGAGTHVSVASSTFSSNTGEIGIFGTYDLGHLSVTGSHFESNTGGGSDIPDEGRGGVFFFGLNASGSISESSFVGNSAKDKGGVAFLDGNCNVHFVNVTFEHSAAQFGGVISASWSNVSFSGLYSQDSFANSSGGFMYSEYGFSYFNNATIRESSTLVAGGVFGVNIGGATYVDTRIEDSYALYLGGVVWTTTAVVNFFNVSSTDSYAGDRGGVAWGDEATFNFVDVTVRHSFGGNTGGFLSCLRSNVRSVNVSAHDLTAASGAFMHLWLIDGFVVVNDSSIDTLSGGSVVTLQSNPSPIAFAMEVSIPCLDGPFLECLDNGCPPPLQAGLNVAIGCISDAASLCTNGTVGAFCQETFPPCPGGGSCSNITNVFTEGESSSSSSSSPSFSSSSSSSTSSSSTSSTSSSTSEAPSLSESSSSSSSSSEVESTGSSLFASSVVLAVPLMMLVI